MKNIQGQPRHRGALKIIEYYPEHDGNHINTADVYAKGKSEEIVGRAVKRKRNKVMLATKIRFPTSKNPNAEGLSRIHLINVVYASLKTPLYPITSICYIYTAGTPVTHIEETLRTLEKFNAFRQNPIYRYFQF